MKRLRIYVDTSVIGGCHDEEFAPWSNGLMTEFRLSVFKPILSETTAAELLSAPGAVRDTYSELLTLDHEVFEVTEEVPAR